MSDTPPPEAPPFHIHLSDIFVLLLFIGIHQSRWHNPPNLTLILFILVTITFSWMMALYGGVKFLGYSRYRTLVLIVIMGGLSVPLNLVYQAMHAVGD